MKIGCAFNKGYVFNQVYYGISALLLRNKFKTICSHFHLLDFAVLGVLAWGVGTASLERVEAWC